MENPLTFQELMKTRRESRIFVSAFADGSVVISVSAGNGTVSTQIHLTDGEADTLRWLIGQRPAVVEAA